MANGLTLVMRGSSTVTASNFVAAHDTSGSFTVNVGSAAAPEPGSIALLALSGLPVAGMIARRRRGTKGIPSAS